jgi:hypothetical protein
MPEKGWGFADDVSEGAAERIDGVESALISDLGDALVGAVQQAASAVNARIADELPKPDPEGVLEARPEATWRQVNALRQVFCPEQPSQIPVNVVK